MNESCSAVAVGKGSSNMPGKSVFVLTLPGKLYRFFYTGQVWELTLIKTLPAGEYHDLYVDETGILAAGSSGIYEVSHSYAGWGVKQLLAENYLFIRKISAQFASYTCAFNSCYSLNPLSCSGLTVEKQGSGTVTSTPGGIDCGNDCLESFFNGVVVTLTATPAPGWIFSEWTGDLNGSTNPVNITMSGSKTVTARFILGCCTLNLAKAGSGSAKVNGVPRPLPWSEVFAPGSEVDLEAVPDSGWSFSSRPGGRLLGAM